MKIRIAVLTAAVMLVLAFFGGQAEGIIPDFWGQPTETPRPAAFFFRGGVMWNMSRDQVRSLEPMELTERSNEDWSVLFPLSPVEVSLYTADLVYMFQGDRLKMIQYDFGAKGNASDFLYLTGALDTVYGEHDEPDAAEIVRLMDQIYPTYYRTESITDRNRWTAADGSRIYLFYYSPGAYTILYANPSNGTGAGGYVTTGL